MSSSNSAGRQEIDKALLEMLDILSQYRLGRSDSSSTLKRAYFDLAQARRSAGYRWISPDLYSGRTQAIATVQTDEDTAAISVSRCSSTRAEEGPATNTSGDDSSLDKRGLRRRRVAKSAPEDSEEHSGSSDEEHSGSSDDEPAPSPASKDPLHWFGLLVPPTLRNAQSGFIESLDQLVALAQLTRVLMQKQEQLAHALAAAADARK